MYQTGPPPSYPGTFSPAGSVEGSPMHNIYMNQPGQTAAPQYQAMPGAATGEDVCTKQQIFSFNNIVFYFICFTLLYSCCHLPHFLQIQIWSMRTCIRQQAPMDRLLLLLVRVLQILVHHTRTTNPHPHRAIRSDLTHCHFLTVIDRIFSDKFLIVQNVVSQAQSMPPMSQAVPTNGMGYMGYQPYSMQNMISALPGQDPNMPPQPPYMPGQQPIYQQVSLFFF